jgi:hypothetical protein
MNKKQIIDKIIDDLPTRDMRGEMSPDEWYGWFEEAFDKGYAEALRIHDVVGRREELTAFAEYCENEHGLFIPSWMIDGYNKSR